MQFDNHIVPLYRLYTLNQFVTYFFQKESAIILALWPLHEQYKKIKQ